MRRLIGVLAGAVLLAGCTAAPAPRAPFPAGVQPDYQLGGAYDPPAGVGVVARDSLEQPAPGVYSICYVNGFQTQPGEDWPDALLLHTETGEPLIDPNWPDETLIDISTADKREQAADRIADAVKRCASSGFDAVEFDNLDSYTRSDGLLTENDAIAFATLLVASATEHGLAAGQKNTPQLGGRGPEIGFDFVIAEECARYRECAAYAEVYGDRVIDIEYADDLDRPFAEICADPETPRATILRDRDLRPLADREHVYKSCAVSPPTG